VLARLDVNGPQFPSVENEFPSQSLAMGSLLIAPVLSFEKKQSIIAQPYGLAESGIPCQGVHKLDAGIFDPVEA